MSMSPFLFVKGYEERLDEFKSVLSDNLKANEIQKQWSIYIELVIEPTGWQAIWKMSRDVCAEFKTNFPCTVIVMVQEVNFKEHSCLVTIHGVEDDRVCLPNKISDVPLIELYPTVEQDTSTALALETTAELVDSLRLFYNHLWMPWDLEFDEDISWINSHLEGRLKLYYLLMERKVPYEIAHAVRNLVTEGRQIQHKIECTQDSLIEEMNVDSPSSLLTLTELHNRLSIIYREYTMYEKPHLLKGLIERKQSQDLLQQESQTSESELYLVLPAATPEQLYKLATLMAEVVSNKKSNRVLVSLEDALVKAPARSSVWVTQGEHPILDLGNLEAGGTIKGVEPGVVVTNSPKGCSNIDLLKGSTTMIGLTLHITATWNIIKIRPKAECCLSEVKLEGSTVTDGVDVFPSAKLSASNCHFTNCRTAIICYTNSTVILSNCTFADNSVALEVREGCNLTMENCVISGSKLYGVHALFREPACIGIENSIENINSFPQIKESGTICKDNPKDLHFSTANILGQSTMDYDVNNTATEVNGIV